MASDGVVAWAVALAGAILLIGACAQGRLRHALLWLMGAVPREKPRLEATVPRGHGHWSLVGPLGDVSDVPKREEAST
jgi:hypothetical protein